MQPSETENAKQPQVDPALLKMTERKLRDKRNEVISCGNNAVAAEIEGVLKEKQKRAKKEE